MGHGAAGIVTNAPAITLRGECDIGGRKLFPSINLEIAAGAWTCLLGSSGAGKSTILRALAGLEIGGSFTGTIEASDGLLLPERVAFMAQDDLLFPWLTVLDNVCVGARLRGDKPEIERAQQLIAQVGLGDQITQKPETLSGGERQRVALARTMMEDRPIIFLDEPFSALDARNRAEMQELAFDLFKGRTILLVTHDPVEAARIADALFVLTENGLTAVDTPDTPPIRSFEDPSALQCQARLLTILRGTP